MQVYWIWLAQLDGISVREKHIVAAHFSSPEDLYHADVRTLPRMEGVTQKGVQALQNKDLKEAKKIAAVCRDRQIRVLCWSDSDYPQRLRNIADPPLVLYCRGTLPDFDQRPTIGVVGTRKASSYGLTQAQRIGREMAQCGGIVVSGMAAGIDAMATRGALQAKKMAVGVLGCGIDRVYPMCNRELFRQMGQEGCLISEYPPGDKPERWKFPQRNRIISGLSNGVVIVEAPKISGALITARQALEQGRDVFAVPGNVGVATCEGSNTLLKEGAGVALSGADVISEYSCLYPDKIHSEEQPPESPVQPQEMTVDNSLPTLSIEKKADTDLSPAEQAVLSMLSQEAKSMDDLIAAAGMPTAEFLSALTMLEVKGYAHTLPGRRVVRQG